MKLNMLGQSLNGGMFTASSKEGPIGYFLACADALMKLNPLDKSLNCGMFYSKFKTTSPRSLSRLR
jgi:hypothetical protein